MRVRVHAHLLLPLLTSEVVGWAFKRDRFEHHAKALGLSPLTYAGCGTPCDAAGAHQGEQHTLAAYLADPLGNSGELLRKRRTRNPFNYQSPYTSLWAKKLVW
jgi:hypothetical protein